MENKKKYVKNVRLVNHKQYDKKNDFSFLFFNNFSFFLKRIMSFF